MSFKERLYKRDQPTRIRATEQQALIDSHLLCLRLSPDFNPDAMEEMNQSYTRQALEKEHELRQNYKSEEVTTKTVTIEDIPISELEIPEATATENIGQVDGGFKQAKPSQNFASFKPISPQGNNVFIHGKEMFSPDAAWQYFSPGTDSDVFPTNRFGEVARKKIRILFEPESFSERLFDYCKPETYVDWLAGAIKELEKQFPSFRMPEHPPITEENLREIGMLTLRTMETHGIEVDDLMQKSRFPSAESIDEEKSKVRKLALARFQETCDGMTAELKERYGWELIVHLESHDYDPEIIANFTKGLEAEPAQGKSLEQILRTGIERRTEEQLRILARQMDNPYDEKFLRAEKQVADVLTHSVHPRVLRGALERKTAVLTTDNFGIGIFNDIMNVDVSHAAGKHTPKLPDHSPNMNDHIMLSAPNLNYHMLGAIAAHEFEHHRDLRRPKSFTAVNRIILPPDQLATMRNRIKEVKEFLVEFDADASPEDVKRLNGLASLRGLPGKAGETSAGKLIGIKDKLFWDVSMMDDILSLTFLPPDGGQSHEAYNSKFAQRIEVPAVMEQLRKLVGRDFVAALLPELHALYMQDRLRSKNLRG